MGKSQEFKLTTKQISVCGIMLALSVILLYLASIIPGIELTMMAAVGALVFMITSNYTTRVGRIFFVASVLISLILAPGKIALLPYIFCLGPYGLIKNAIEKYTSKFAVPKKTNNKKSNRSENRVNIRLTTDAEYVPNDELENADFGKNENFDDNGSSAEKAEDEELNGSKKKNTFSNAKKYVIEYSLKILGFMTCVAICILFIFFVMGQSPTEILFEGISSGNEFKLFAKIGVGLAYAAVVVAGLAVFILYDNLIRLINIVFGKYMR